MGRQAKIIKYELEQLVMQMRQRGRNAEETRDAINDELAHRGVKDTVTTKAVERYLATLDKATVPLAHQPQVAEQNSTVVFDVAKRLGLLDDHVTRWIVQADSAVRPVQGVVWDTMAGQPISADKVGGNTEEDPEHEHVVVGLYEIDWQARKAASSELRQTCEAIANLLQRVHDAEHVRAFQESFNEAIAEASPEVAAAVLAKLEQKQSIVRANLLGAPVA